MPSTSKNGRSLGGGVAHIYIYMCMSLLSIKNIHCVSSYVAQNIAQYPEFIMIMNILFLGQRPAKRVSHNGQGWGIGKGMVKPLFSTVNIGKHSFGRF